MKLGSEERAVTSVGPLVLLSLRRWPPGQNSSVRRDVISSAVLFRPVLVLR